VLFVKQSISRFGCEGGVYGPWQRESEDERLRSSIDGQPVCEIDLKASYVAIAIANAVLGEGTALGSDPYQQIKFVRSANDGPDRTRMREAAAMQQAWKEQYPGRKIGIKVTDAQAKLQEET